MQIGNMDWKHCRLETSKQIGNIQSGLETKLVHWKHEYQIRNKKRRLKTQKYDWKQKMQIGNIALYSDTC